MVDLISEVKEDGKKEKAEEGQEPGKDDEFILPEAGTAPGTPQPTAEAPPQEADGAGGGAGTDVLQSTDGGGTVFRMVQVATEGLKPINLYGTTPGVVQISEIFLTMGYKMAQVDGEKMLRLFDPGTQHVEVKLDNKLRPALENAATQAIQCYVDSCGADAVTGVMYQQVSPYLPVPFTNIYLMYDDGGAGQDANELEYVKSQVQDRLHESNVIVVYSSADISSLMEALDE